MLISKYDTKNIDDYIKEYENKYDFTFPKSYREFLKKYNGGDTPDTNFKIGKISSDLQGFLGLGKESQFLNYNVFEKTKTINEYLHEEMVPIAINSFGDIISMSISKMSEGRVYFLYHDKPKKYIELTENFFTFVDNCKSKKIGNIRTIEERKQKMIENGLGDKITEASIKGWQAEIDKYGNMYQEKLIL